MYMIIEMTSPAANTNIRKDNKNNMIKLNIPSRIAQQLSKQNDEINVVHVVVFKLYGIQITNIRRGQRK